MVIIYLLSCLLAAVGFLFVYGLNLVQRWRFRHLPGPKPSWLLGNVTQMPQGKSHECMLDWAQRYGPVYKYFLGRTPAVVLSDPELVRQVAVKHFIHYHDRAMPVIVIGEQADTLFQNSGILFARGKYWLGIRTACEPMFHSAALESYAPMMHTAFDKLLEKLQGAATSDESICVSDHLKATALDVIGTTAFGVDFKAQEQGSSSDLVTAAEAMFAPFGGFPVWAALLMFALPDLSRVWYRLANLFHRKQVQRRVADRRYLWGASQALLDAARKHGQPAPQPADLAGGEAAAGAPAHRVGMDIAKGAESSAAFQQAYKALGGKVPPESSIVSRLKNAINKQTGQPLTDLDICAQLFTFLLAGYETTSLALSYSLYLLAQHPEHQRRVMQEVDALGANEPGYDDLPRLPFTEAVFHESMRLYPPVAALLALMREPREGGMELPLSGASNSSYAGNSADGSLAGTSSVHIPEGTRVMFNIWAIHRDPKLWPQPEEFRPERFLPNAPDAATRHPAAYFPFGLGPRKCVGWRFALEEGVLCLARIFQRFELRLDVGRHRGPLNLMSSVTMAPEGGIWLKVHARQDKQGR